MVICYTGTLLISALFGSISIAQTDTDLTVFEASENGNTEMVKAMVTANPAVMDLHDRYGKTPLHYAVCGNHENLIAYFLENGGSVMARDNRGWTALHYAADNGNPDIVEMLLSHHADVDAVDAMQWTPLHHAVMRGHTRVVLCLIKHGANVFAKTSSQTTADAIALAHGQLAIKDYLAAQMIAQSEATHINGYSHQ